MALAVVAGGFSAGKADELRRAMAAWKRKSQALADLGEELILGLIGNGYEPGFAERLFDQILGFGEYGFPESHAASFALIVYVSAWLKKHHPAAFAAALINSQPMGFYAPAQIVRAAVEQDIADGKLLGVRRTPGFFVNGKPLENFGARPLVELVGAAVREQYAKKKE